MEEFWLILIQFSTIINFGKLFVPSNILSSLTLIEFNDDSRSCTLYNINVTYSLIDFDSTTKFFTFTIYITYD